MLIDDSHVITKYDESGLGIVHYSVTEWQGCKIDSEIASDHLLACAYKHTQYVSIRSSGFRHHSLIA